MPFLNKFMVIHQKINRVLLSRNLIVLWCITSGKILIKRLILWAFLCFINEQQPHIPKNKRACLPI